MSGLYKNRIEKENYFFTLIIVGCIHELSTIKSTGVWIIKTDTKERYSFDAWGRRRNPTDWTYNSIPSTFLFSRGFTGHEHLDQFVLINMNGRVYDPLLGRFLSPDNFVQSPDFTQSFNRYGYCLNNPLKYSDPSGNSFLGIGGNFIFGFLKGLFHGDNPLKSGWKQMANSVKMDAVFAKSVFSGEIITQTPQVIAGYVAADFTNSWQYNTKATIYDGALVMENCWDGGSFSLGPFIQLGTYTSMYKTYTNPITGKDQRVLTQTFMHEYGHYVQSQASGWFYLPKYGIPSFLKPGNDAWMEYDASLRGYNYFNTYHSDQMRLIPRVVTNGNVTVTIYDNWDDNADLRATKITNPDWGDIWRMMIPSFTFGGFGQLLGWKLIINKNSHE